MTDTIKFSTEGLADMAFACRKFMEQSVSKMHLTAHSAQDIMFQTTYDACPVVTGRLRSTGMQHELPLPASGTYEFDIIYGIPNAPYAGTVQEHNNWLKGVDADFPLFVDAMVIAMAESL